MMNPHTHSTTENILDLLAAINLDLAGQPASRTNAPLPETQYHPVFWQAVENTVLDIRSVNPNLSEDELIKMLTTWGWMSWTKVPQQNSPDIRYLGVYFHTLKPRSTTTIAHTAILISWPVQERGGLVEHLHQLGKALKSQFRPWSAIAGAVLGTEHFFQSNPDSDDFVPMGAVFAGFTQDLVHETGKAISEKRAQQIAWDCLQRVPKDGHDLLTRYKLDAVSTALVLLELGQLLWTPRVLQHMAHRRFQYAKAVAVWHFLGDLADNWLYLVEQDCRKIEVCGKPLRVGPSELWPWKEWRQAIEMERWGSPHGVLYSLRRDAVFSHFSEGNLPGYDPEQGNRLAEQLLEDARENAVYIPKGSFQVSLPADTPLGIFTELSLRTYSGGLWVQSNMEGMVFYWRPEHPSILVAPEWDDLHASAMHLILAALWRDLVVEGEWAVIQCSGEIFMRKRIMKGCYTWGMPEEVKQIRSLDQSNDLQAETKQPPQTRIAAHGLASVLAMMNNRSTEAAK